MHRRTFVLALVIAFGALAVPWSAADTQLAVPASPLPFMTLTLTVEGTGKRTFRLYPETNLAVTLGAETPRFEYSGPLVPADPGATPFQSVFLAMGSSRSKVDEVKGKYAFKYSSRTDPPTAVFSFLEMLLLALDLSLPDRWVDEPVVVDGVKMSGKAKRARTGSAYDGKVKISFTGLTFSNRPVKGTMAIAFAQAPVAP
jgi:hypothetical protein